ncbi:MAG: aspartate kinase [Bacteroidetes bacterium]|nr:aspartate kinase [Bacteroidota bacterium]MCL2302085.1 aspartate kinase [Lentimicrobiaceae bacterium]
MYRIFKFGGASVKDAEGVKNLKKILEIYKDEKLIVVISAMGKMTNQLEKVLDSWYYDPDSLQSNFEVVKKYHLDIASQLENKTGEISSVLRPILDKLFEILSGENSKNYDKDYDNIVSFGEYLSTQLISIYLNLNGYVNKFACAIPLIITDDSYREGKVNWEKTEKAIHNFVAEHPNKTIITQGFIAGTMNGEVTTLGREGSDFSAAIFAYCLNAENVTIWKDVPGLLNADPKFYPNAVKLDEISYQEAIELAYYGATIIHPKTIKPLQNKHIPLFVKSFLSPHDAGSIIADVESSEQIPSYIFKTEQILLSIFPKDFSFIAADNLTKIFSYISKNKLKINLMQNSAVSFTICMDNKPNRFANLLKDLQEDFTIKYNMDKKLITIRHYTQEAIDQVIGNQPVILEQKSRSTLQVIL